MILSNINQSKMSKKLDKLINKILKEKKDENFQPSQDFDLAKVFLNNYNSYNKENKISVNDDSEENRRNFFINHLSQKDETKNFILDSNSIKKSINIFLDKTKNSRSNILSEIEKNSDNLYKILATIFFETSHLAKITNSGAAKRDENSQKFEGFDSEKYFNGINRQSQISSTNQTKRVQLKEGLDSSQESDLNKIIDMIDNALDQNLQKKEEVITKSTKPDSQNRNKFKIKIPYKRDSSESDGSESDNSEIDFYESNHSKINYLEDANLAELKAKEEITQNKTEPTNLNHSEHSKVQYSSKTEVLDDLKKEKPKYPAIYVSQNPQYQARAIDSSRNSSASPIEVSNTYCSNISEILKRFEPAKIETKNTFATGLLRIKSPRTPSPSPEPTGKTSFNNLQQQR